MTANGTGARLREESQPVLAGDVVIDELTPRNVHGYFTRLLAQRMGSELLIVDSPGADNVRALGDTGRLNGRRKSGC